nr:MAG TPA: hypothetical protein [Microviridae sp.]
MNKVLLKIVKLLELAIYVIPMIAKLFKPSPSDDPQKEDAEPSKSE